MVEPGLLKEIRFFEELSDEMIDRLANLAELRTYDPGEYLNRKRRSADFLYVLIEGSISLEIEGITGDTVTLETLFPGVALGFSSLVETEPKKYLSDARALTPTKALRFRSDDLMQLFYQDFELGFLIMKKIALIAKNRVLHRTAPIDGVSETKTSRNT